MPRIRLSVSAVSLQQPKWQVSYGMLSVLPVHMGTGFTLLRAPTARIPDDAIITSATLSFWQMGVTESVRSFTLREVTEPWSTKVTFKNRPAVGQILVEKSDTGAEGKRWDFDVTQAIQKRVDGVLVPFGWSLAGNETEQFRFWGSTASRRQPVLTVDYSVLPAAPSNLHPSGVVSRPDPWLTFDADDEISSLQVEIADSAGVVVFDSGTVAASGGVLKLEDTTFGGFSAGASYTWRVRQMNAAGWSPWSDPVELTYEPQDVLDITQPPGSTFSDWTPPIEWTFSGVQTAWRARFSSEDGTLFDDSGYTVGTLAGGWTPRRGPRREGEECRIEVMVWDDSERTAAPGDPEYVRVSKVVTFAEGPIDPMETINATQDGYSPVVTITGTRSVVPDGLDLWRDDGDGFRRVASYEAIGSEVFDGTTYTVTDITAPMSRPVTYKVVPRVNGQTITTGPTVTITPTCKGIWVTKTDIETGALSHAVIRVEGVTEPEVAQPEKAIVHEPLGSPEASGDDLGQVVRRRMLRYRPQGRVEGVLWEHPFPASIPSAVESEALLRDIAEGDAGQLYRITYSGLNEVGILANLTFGERHENQPGRRVVSVDFDWFAQGDNTLS